MPAALLIDIKDSRKYDPDSRNEIQEYFVALTDYINCFFEPSLKKELRFSAGDEIQGLFDGVGAAYTCLRWFSRLAAPIKIHAGIGVGEWSTRISDLDTNYQDGSAYHNARAAIDKAKKETDYMALIASRSDKDPCWNSMMNAGFQLVENNTANQNELAILLEFLCPVGEEFMRPIELQKLHSLIQQKNKLTIALNSSKQSTKTSFPDSVPEGCDEDILKLREYASRSSDVLYIRAHPYGTASVIAKLTKKATKDNKPIKQSVDITLKASNVYAERAIALALVEGTKDRLAERTDII